MRTIYGWLLATLAAAALSCGGGDDSPATPGDPTPGELGATALPGGDALPAPTGFAGLGGYTLEVDLNSLSATATMWRKGAATDDLYFLAVDNFLRPNSLAVESIQVTPTTVNLNYRFTHPFPAPTNLAGPATAGNRADLGIAARLLVLADVPGATGNTYFGGQVANTDLVTNADGYYAPNGLLTETGSLTANTFPFKLIVDEGAGSGGNRGEADNGGTATGNYRVDLDGWQQDNLTNNGVNNGWTGFGVLHQGQSAANTLQLDRTQLTGSTFRLDTAVIAKYIDPRGGNNAAEKRANRLPKNPADVRLFVYRMPFGAIDAELVRPLGETGGLVPNNIVSNTTVRFQVRDWDARATESTQPDLKDELNPSLVPSGTSGPPTVQVDVPGVTATPALLNLVDDDSAFGGDPEVDSGVARDPLFYQGVVQNSAASGGGQTAGPRKGLLKAEDPENLLDRSAYEFALDPTLTPLTGNKPELVTYQAFTVSLGGGPANDPPTATVALAAGTNPTVASGGALDFLLTAEFDTENDAVTYSVDITNDGTFELTDYDPATAPPPDVLLYAGTAPVNTGAAPVPYMAKVEYKDPTHPASTILLDYSVNPAGANSPPTANVNLLCAPIPSGGTLAFELAAENDPDGDTVTYQIDYDFTGTFTPDAGPINPPNAPTPAYVFHLSPAQTNPGGTPLTRTARIRYTDGVNPPINIDRTYTLVANSCPAQTRLWDFNADLGGWVYGPTFFNSSLNNSDLSGWGHFTRSCSTTETESRTGGAIGGGGYITSGDDGDDVDCSYLYDYGRQADYNLVSPWINVPTLCAPGTLKVDFDAVVFARTGATARLFVSTDYGVSWGTPVWTWTGTGAEHILSNTTVCLPDSLAGQDILLRFQFQDTTDSTFALPTPYNNNNNSVALTLDNVTITAGSTTPITSNPPTLPCAPRSRLYDFTTAQGWQGGQAFGLPNGDAQGSGTPNAGGWSSLRPTNCDSSNTTYAAVVAASAGAINGFSINGTDDGTGYTCGGFYFRDYAANANWNVVSPRILVPPSCSGSDTVTLSWKAYLNTDDGNYQDATWETCSTCGGEDGPDMTVVVRAYLSIDNGATWGTPIWSANTTLAGQTFNVAVPVNSLAGLASGVRVRFEFVSTATVTQSDDPNDPFGFYVDDVKFESSNTNGFYTTF